MQGFIWFLGVFLRKGVSLNCSLFAHLCGGTCLKLLLSVLAYVQYGRDTVAKHAGRLMGVKMAAGEGRGGPSFRKASTKPQSHNGGTLGLCYWCLFHL